MKKKRDYGDGGVYWVEARQRWVAQIYVGYDANGKRKAIRSAHRSKADAKRALEKKLHLQRQNLLSYESGMKLSDLLDEWMRYELTDVAPGTKGNYATIVNSHIIPMLGKKRLRDLKTRDVERLLVELSGTLSSRTLRLVKSILCRAIDRAVAHEYISRNVANLAQVPRGREGRKSKALSIDEVKKILDGTRNTPLYGYLVLSIFTGARTEEVRSLRWEDVHLAEDPAYIAVYRSVRLGGDTKTRRSRRTIALPDACIEVLKQERVRQEDLRDTAGPRWIDTGLVFTSSTGTGLDASNVRRDFRKALESIDGINENSWTPRELRHTFVSILSDQGMPIDEIARLVGHSSTNVTEAVYRHQIRPVVQTGAQMMNHIFSGE